ncbi:hypothetical protein BH23ACT4_BH23ACT4_03650 [soil metagenome]
MTGAIIDFVLVTGEPFRVEGVWLIPDVWIERHPGEWPDTWNAVRDDGRFVAVYR